MVSPGNAAVVIDVGLANDSRLLFLERKGRYGLHGANLTAGIAGKLAKSHARYQEGNAGGFNPGSIHVDLQSAGRAHLQAQSAAYATGREIAGCHAGRAKEKVLGRLFEPVQ